MASKKTNRYLLLFVIFLFPMTMMGQDVVTLKDGSSLTCNILEVGDNQITFKQTGSNETMVLPISEIDCITYANGEKETFGKQKDAFDKQKSEKKQKQEDDNISHNHDYSPPVFTPDNNEDVLPRLSIWGRLGAAIFKSHYSDISNNSYKSGFEVTFGAKYILTNNLQYKVARVSLDAGVGYYELESNMKVSGYISNTKNKCLNVPIELTLTLPLSKYFGVDIGAGPSLMYLLGGKINMNGDKYSISEFEKEYDTKVKKFSSILCLRAGIHWNPYTLSAYLGIPLTKVSDSQEEKDNFWGITLGFSL